MLSIHMLNADHGDCLWVEYGERGQPPKRILVDCGTERTYREHLKRKIQATIAKEGKVRFELFVVTHIDDDHIGGALRFLDDVAAPDSGMEIGEIWFNSYPHLDNEAVGFLGGAQGEKLTTLILRGGWAWNSAFGTRAVMVPEDGPLPQVPFAGMRLTLLSPDLPKLQRLKGAWAANARKAGLIEGEGVPEAETVVEDGWLGEDQSGDVDTLQKIPFRQDTARANGSSIAFLADYDGARVLFGADAYPTLLLESAARPPLAHLDPLRLDAFKLPHHGSKNNLSLDLLKRFPAKHYLISTTGQQFKHPDAPAIARILHAAKGRDACLHFNCPSDYNSRWDDDSCREEYGYQTKYGTFGEGLVVEIATAGDA